ncbi:hypothetical protein N8V39_19980 [Enterobacter hormaechei subsp. steigerwaltii]|uniref:tail fiber/spike domain-containing protein n=1 Tax=Enterobacter hormaechei TaxID=158836 RepID=UPI0007913886|nr:hypothetical protein [Enterobacter hormaechei]MCU2290069.1 hypothetical protein [Enterobacter hormaechei subsp. steigerwaltii]MCU2299097.1 hypothetical protein [Enterobacter hormaechei subsp. steigerwaltii]MCU2321099.1 hypothetical protein [Enterobacter hormaechei subsp. steigerwaltii]MCU2334710.1 hypothetical protein [Enterobacter hormaechei subsp. steigerwaltii]MCU2341927.1 hypothetical protein [Enterobacter hormaechei subsp. steigerwaltii]
MATTPTNLPVPSESPIDLKFNAGKIDEFVTSMGWTYTDRFGQKHYTIEGINYLAQQAMAAFGYVILTGKTFTTGATINNPNEVLLNTADGEYYKWTGSFASGPKVVPANSTPASTGGIGPGVWVGVGDASLRAALAALGGAGLIGFNYDEPYATNTVGSNLKNVIAKGISVSDLPAANASTMGHSYNVNGQTLWADSDAFGLKYNKTGMLMRHLALLGQGGSRDYALWADQIIYEDNFTNLSGWTGLTANAMQVSGNKVYSNGQGGNSGMSRALNISNAGKFRLRCLINFVNDGTTAYSGGVFVGINSGAVGAYPASGLSDAFGIYFTYNSVRLLLNGTASNTTNTTVPIAGLYEVTLVADTNYISVAVHHTSESFGYEYVARLPRATKACSNVVIFNSDARLLSGSSIQSLCMGVGSNATIKSNFEGNYPSITWTGDGTNDFRIVTPVQYDSRKPRPAVMLFHGDGTNERSWATNANYDKISKAFVASGFIVISAAVSGDYNTWGNTLAQSAYYSAYRYLVLNYNISAFSVFANSMGGIEFFNTLASENFGVPCCFVGTSPTANLKSCYNSPALTASIKEAYNIANDGSDYEAKTSGFDPVLKRPDEFLGIPQLWLTASDDTLVLPNENRDVMMKLSAISTSKISKVDGITGGHSFDVTPYLTTIVNFVRMYSA